jgi:hypothetical protein
MKMGGRAKANPNDRRRINKITRAVLAGEVSSPKAGVDAWMENRTKAKKARPAWMQRGDGRAMMQHIASGKAQPSTKASRKKAAKVRRQVAAAFETHPGYGPSTRYVFGRKKTQTYGARATGSHASRYRVKDKKTTAPGRGFAQGRDVVIVNVEGPGGVKAWNKTRASRRARGLPGHTKPWGAKASTTKTGRPKRSGKKRTLSSWQQEAKSLGIRYVGQPKAKVLAEIAAQKGGASAVANPLMPTPHLGALAYQNPSMGTLEAGWSSWKVQLVPMLAGGVLGGGVHAVAAVSGVTSAVADGLDRIPVVGTYAADHLLYTTQGAAAGLGFALLGAAFGPGQARQYLAVAGASALLWGIGTDLFSWATGAAAQRKIDEGAAIIDAELDATLSEMESALPPEGAADGLGALAYQNPGMGGLAYSTEDLGGLAYEPGLGDGFAADVVPLTGQAPLDGADADSYGQARMGDAEVSGSDFSGTEAQAMSNGREAYFRCFGHPPVRAAVLNGTENSPRSHLAGREGHRWGWLIRWLGWDRAQQLAAMPPAPRRAAIQRIRSAAIQAFRAEYAQMQQQREISQAHAAQQAQSQSNPAPAMFGDPSVFVGG